LAQFFGKKSATYTRVYTVNSRAVGGQLGPRD